MPRLDIDTALEWRGRTVRDRDGEKIGSFGDVYLDRQTDLPAWGGIRTGLFGGSESFVPLDGISESDDGDLVVPFERDMVKDAPHVDPDVALNEDEEARLYAHYQQDYAPLADTPEDRERVDVDRDEGDRVDIERDPPAEGEGASVIRSEEEVVAAHGAMRPSERVRLRKVMVTDEVTKTVPVRREVVQLEHEPAPEGEIESVEDVDQR